MLPKTGAVHDAARAGGSTRSVGLGAARSKRSAQPQTTFNTQMGPRRPRGEIKRRLSKILNPAPPNPVRPEHHTNDTQSGFRNPWPSAQPPSWTELVAAGNPLQWAVSGLHQHEKAKQVKVVKPDWGLSLPEQTPPSLLAPGPGPRLLTTWLGHASALVQIPLSHATNKGKEADIPPSTTPRVSILFDPIFSARAGPTAYTGPSRINPSPCSVEDIPACHIVCISHNQSVWCPSVARLPFSTARSPANATLIFARVQLRPPRLVHNPGHIQALPRHPVLRSIGSVHFHQLWLVQRTAD